MKTILLTVAMFSAALASAYPGPQINGNQINPQTGITVSTLTATGQTGMTSGKYTATATPGFTGDISGGTGLPAATGLSGQVPIANGGTNLSSAGGTANRVLRTSNGTSFAVGQVIGPDIAASTVPLNSLNQSGATDGQVISWNNSAGAWQPANAGITATGLTAGVVPVATSGNALGSGNGFITSVSTGVAISTNVSLGVSGSSVIINGAMFNGSFMYGVPLGTTTFTNVTMASVTLPSGYSEYWIIGTVQNTNASARTLQARFGGDTGSNYKWGLDNLPASAPEYLSCAPSSYIDLTDSTSNAGRVGASAYAGVTMNIHKPTSSLMIYHADTDVSVIDSDIPSRMVMGGRYTGTSQGEIEFGMATPGSCTSTTFSASSISGTLRLFGLP